MTPIATRIERKWLRGGTSLEMLVDLFVIESDLSHVRQLQIVVGLIVPNSN
jgi:hypothetical protein